VPGSPRLKHPLGRQALTLFILAPLNSCLRRDLSTLGTLAKRAKHKEKRRSCWRNGGTDHGTIDPDVPDCGSMSI
jgi:hypothetical protein